MSKATRKGQENTRPDTDIDGLRAFWSVLAQPGGVHEVRIPKTRRGPRCFSGTVSGYFNDVEAFISSVDGIAGQDAEAVYVTLNPVNPDLLARAANWLKNWVRESTSDGDIVRRTTLLIDVDPVRPSGISATDEEREAALVLRDQIREYLSEYPGWPEPLAVTMSGNGGGLLYRLDLPNTEEVTTLVKRVLEGLACTFDIEGAKVDVSTFNPARITKVIGTVAAKGDSLPHRPWRMATGTFTPNAPPVPREALERVAGLVPTAEERSPDRPGGERRTGRRTWDLRELLTREAIGYREKPRSYATVLELDRCLISSDHTDGAAILEFPNGAVAYRCLHNRCADKRWGDVREVLGLGRTQATGVHGVNGQAAIPAELTGRRIHPAIHFDADGFASVGIVAPGPDGRATTEIITSERRAYPVEALTPILTTPAIPHKSLVNRWPGESRAAWLSGKTKPVSFARTTEAVLGGFTALLDTQPSTLVILSVWTVATYFHRLFPAFGRLFLTGEAQSGKSKAQAIVAALAFNGLYRVAPTGAVLFRLIEAIRPTYCVSEAEHVDGEQKQVLQAVINEGYTQGGTVDRCVGDTQELRTFEVYAPLTLGSIKGLKGVTENRAISLVMVRGLDKHKLNADVDPESPAFQEARDLLYRLTLERSRDVAETWRTLPNPDWLVGRERQLWRPLLVLAHLADSEGAEGKNLIPAILEIAQKQTRDRSHPSDEAEALVTVLDEALSRREERRLHPADLVEDLKGKLHRDFITPAWVGHLLRRNGFEKPPPPGDRDANGVVYVVTRAKVEEIRARYCVPLE